MAHARPCLLEGNAEELPYRAVGTVTGHEELGVDGDPPPVGTYQLGDHPATVLSQLGERPTLSQVHQRVFPRLTA